jgi:hypothetical protein
VQQAATLRAFSRVWLADRPLKPSSRELYMRVLEQKILPALGDVLLKDITPLTVGSAVTDDLLRKPLIQQPAALTQARDSCRSRAA